MRKGGAFEGVFPKLNEELPKLQHLLGETQWTTGLTFECFGVRIGILTTAGLSLDDMRSLLPPYSRELPSGLVDRIFSIKVSADESVVFNNEIEKLRFPGSHWIAEALRGQLKHCVSQLTAERVFVHAGVVAWQNHLILLPGDGFSGKTTLTAELVKAGAVYYSDDFAVIDRDAMVYPYPKPLSMRQRNSIDGQQTDCDVSYFGGIQGSRPLTVSLIVLTEYKARAHWQPKALTPGQGILEILKHTNNSLKQPQIAVQVLQKVVIQAKIVKSKRGEAKKAAQAILQMC